MEPEHSSDCIHDRTTGVGSGRQKRRPGRAWHSARNIVYVATVLGFLALAVGGYVLLHSRVERAASVEQMDAILEMASSSSGSAVDEYLADVDRAVEQLGHELAAMEIADDAVEEVLFAALSYTPQLSGAYLADDNGSFVFVFRNGTEFGTKRIDAGADGSERVVAFTSRNSAFESTTSWRDSTDEYDPRTRPWYTMAIDESSDGIWTEPYTFFTSQLPGITRASVLPQAESRESNDVRVVGVDVELSALIRLMEEMSEFVDGEAFLTTGTSVLTRQGVHDEATAADGRVSGALRARVQQNMAERVEFRRAADAHVALFRSAGSSSEWVVGVELSTEEAISPMLGAFGKQRLIATLIGALLGILFAALFVPLGRRIARLEHDSSTDSLTGLANRREVLRYGNALDAKLIGYAVAVVDVDRFKRINDTFGHAVGDQVLQALGERLGTNGGLVGRVGGEEFAIVFATGLYPDYFDRLEALRLDVATKPFMSSAGPLPVTVSIGLATTSTDFGSSFIEVFDRADKALFVAKESGRNIIVRSTEAYTETMVGDVMVTTMNTVAPAPSEGALVHVAVLDERGVIVAVNRAWTRFAEENGGDPDACGVGVSYLEVCDAAFPDTTAGLVASTLRRVLSEDIATAALIEIPCDAPDEERWFNLAISSRTNEVGETIGATVMVLPTADSVSTERVESLSV